MKYSEIKTGDYFYVRNLKKPSSYPSRFLKTSKGNVSIEGFLPRGKFKKFKQNQVVYLMVAN